MKISKVCFELEMELAIRVQIPDNVICVLIRTNTLSKGINAFFSIRLLVNSRADCVLLP